MKGKISKKFLLILVVEFFTPSLFSLESPQQQGKKINLMTASRTLEWTAFNWISFLLLETKEGKLKSFFYTFKLNNSVQVPFWQKRKLLTLLTVTSSCSLSQIIFDGFTVGRYNEGLDDNNDFESVDTRMMVAAAGGTEACKFFINKINFFTQISSFFYRSRWLYAGKFISIRYS